MIGTTLSHFKIIEKLGEGGMGVVYKAEDTKLKRHVAIKFLSGHVVMNSDDRKRFEIEAQAAASINHPNVTQIYAIEQHDGKPFIVMEYVDGRDLKERISKGPVGAEEAIDIATQIAAGLEAAHEKGVVHRDIKSSNIMITEKGVVKIMDFGLAKIHGGAQLTKQQSTIGTFSYMSPEQTRGEIIDGRTDIWSLGVVCYEMLTGEMPFQGDYEQAVVYSILNEAPKPLSSINKGIPPHLENVVTRALAKDLNKRFQNTSEFIESLRPTAVSHSAVAGRNPVSRKKKWALFAVAGAAGIMVLMIVAGIFFGPENSREISNHAIAVLPFSNTRPDPETDYLGFAIADQIIGNMAYLSHISVRPSGAIRKYINQPVDPSTAGDDLKVDYILAGNYFKESEIIRLNIELIDVRSGNLIWRAPIEVDFRNAFDLQDIVAEKVVRGMNAQFSEKERNRISKDIPDDPLAYEYYLRGIAYPLTNEGDRYAIEMLNKSIALDSGFAPAYARLAERIHRYALYGLRDPEETRESESLYLKALSINKELPFALVNLARIYAETARIDEAVEMVRQTLKINPDNAETHFSLGYIYRYAGMNQEAIQEMEIAVSLDPNNPGFRTITLTYQAAGEYEKAIDISNTYEQESFILSVLGQANLRLGNISQAGDYFHRAVTIDPKGLSGLFASALGAYVEGDTAKGLTAGRTFENADVVDGEAWYAQAGIYGLLGDKEGSLRCLDRAVDNGYFNYPFMLTDPFLNSVRDDPAFQNILKTAKIKHERFKKKYF